MHIDIRKKRQAGVAHGAILQASLFIVDIAHPNKLTIRKALGMYFFACRTFFKSLHVDDKFISS